MTFILFAFFLCSVVAPALYKKLGIKTFYVLAAIPALALVYVLVHTQRILGGDALVQQLQWVPQLNLELTFRLDVLSYIMSLLVLGVGSLVLFYCASYFEHSKGSVGTFAAYLFGFAGAMFGLITADDVIVMFVFWEITTILSYLLIGYSCERLSARRSALQALTITTFGGLAMFIGLVIVGQAMGTYSMREWTQNGAEFAGQVLAGEGSISSTVLSWALFLILLGAISKSALLPMHYWLPGAMAAPTPVSAYLHAAAMVKAGIYLLLRLAPAFGEVQVWHYTLLFLGVATMLFGGYVALKQYDLKLVLAYGTVSQLGFLALVISIGTPDAIYAAIAMMLAHSLFKATLFLSVGIIDHQTGTRDIRKLSGLYRRAPKLFIAALIAAASMAGVPPLAGFVAKEAVLETALHGVHTPHGLLAVAGVVLGSALTFAYSARFVWGAFAVKPQGYIVTDQIKYCEDVDLAKVKHGRNQPSPDTRFHAVTNGFLVAPAVLTVLTIIYGLYPEPVHQLISAHMKTVGEYELHLALWHGITPALMTSVGILVTGIILYIFRSPVERFQKALPAMRGAYIIHRDIMDALDVLAVWVTGKTQRGSLSFYLSVILVTAVTLPTIALFVETTPPLANVRASESPVQWIVAITMIVAAIVAAAVRKRFLAILMVSVTGYGMVLLFALRSAPDLALTQLLVETLSLIAFVLALRVLPRNMPRDIVANRKHRMTKATRMVIAIGFAVLMMALAMFTFSSRELTPISVEMPHLAYEYGYGYNTVNVTLVDMRAWDTFGEISVLALAATGVASLIFIGGRNDTLGANPSTAKMRTIEASFNKGKVSQQRKMSNIFGQVEGSSRDPFLIAGRTLPPEARSLLLEVMTRLLFHTLLIISLYMLVAGHNLPGGGFAGGLLAGLAFTIRYLAGGGAELSSSVPFSAGTFLGTGLAIATLYAVAPLFAGDPVFTSYVWDFWLPVFGDVHFASAVIFDIGVYLLVIGLVLDILRSLGEGIDDAIADNTVNVSEQVEERSDATTGGRK
ncbi:Na+/H+ antiporter subunit A [Rothia sp. ZJ932]|uniref:Na+/H+ antiporter subunit A n=1 Tax=Rothia sp. ZJ932 TaxID=2810516 RepID=UPI001967A627|nr:Na+/H+ antiporter subunit A [Rothia sp. ZJ932]QRZ61697.1 Na+/H+ antiporter subunit A [Rothia sp. ZJ932]